MTHHATTSYCGSIGWEIQHIRGLDKQNWLRQRIETTPDEMPKQERLHLLERLAFAVKFEAFLANKFNTAKRFGLEGCESMVPGMKSMVDVASEMGAADTVVGMAHRGRLSVLANVMRKPLEQVLSVPGRPEARRTHLDSTRTNGVKHCFSEGSARGLPNLQLCP